MKSPYFVATPDRVRFDTEFGASDAGQGYASAAVLGLSLGSVGAILGAPGVGKTALLTKRFVYLVREHGVEPEQILVLAATRESAAGLRDNLLFALTNDEAFAVEGSLARTVASVAFSVVRHHALVNGLRQPELVSGAEQDAILQKLIEGEAGAEASDLWPSHINAVTRGLSGFRAELRNLLASCQERGLKASQLSELSREKQRPEWQAAAVIFSAYEELLLTDQYENRFDSAGLVNRAIELLDADSNLVPFRAVLADDAQELTPSASRLISKLIGTQTELLCFADPDSSTLGFRQGGPENLVQLLNGVAAARGSVAKSIEIETDPWGKPAGVPKVMGKLSSLIGLVGGIGGQAAGRHRVVHTAPATSEIPSSSPGASPALEVKLFSSQQAEAGWLANQLRRAHLLGGTPWGQMAVVARTRQQLEILERALGALSVPVRISGAQQALRDEFASRELLELAALICLDRQVTSDLAERMLRSPFCGLDSLGIRRLRRNLRREELSALAEGDFGRNSDDLLLELFENSTAAETLRGPEAARVRKFLKSIDKAKALVTAGTGTIEELLWLLWDSSGVAQKWAEAGRGVGDLAVQANRNLDAIVALFAAANRFVERNPGKPMEAFLIAQLEQALPEDTLAVSRRLDQFVTLTTPSGLIGNRYSILAVPQLIEGIWPNLKPRNSLLGANLIGVSDSAANLAASQIMSDELRMFYKSIGSANERVLISSYSDPDEQVSQFLAHAAGGQVPEEEDFTEVGLTLRGLAGDLRRKLAVEENPLTRANLAVDLGRLAAAGVPGAHPDEWYGLADISTTEPLFEFVSDGAIADGHNEDGDLQAATGERGQRITVNPSQLDAFVKCPLHWFLNYHGAGGSDFSASVGTLIHHALEVAKSPTEAELWSHVEGGWHSLRFETEWLEQAERRKAKKLVANLSKYLNDFALGGGSVVASEQEFEFDQGLAHIRGKVDRVELLSDGGVMIVDLKTGKSVPTNVEAQVHPQLGLYQLAYQHSAFGEMSEAMAKANLAGAKLVVVSGDSPTIREQESLAINADLTAYFEKLVQDAALGMSMPNQVFVAQVSSHCDAENEFGSCRMHLIKAVSYGE